MRSILLRVVVVRGDERTVVWERPPEPLPDGVVFTEPTGGMGVYPFSAGPITDRDPGDEHRDPR